jgi:hypothetical protein
VQAAILAGILLIGTITLAVMLLTQIRHGVTAFRAWLAAR